MMTHTDSMGGESMEALLLLVGFTLGCISVVIPDYIRRTVYVKQLQNLSEDEVSHWSMRPLPEDPDDLSEEEKKAEKEAGYFGT